MGGTIMNNFTFYNPARIVFGKDTELKAGSLIKEYGTRVLVHFGGHSAKASGLLDRVIDSLQKEGKYKEALDLYLFYFNKDKFVLNLTDRIIQCYRKLNDKSNEKRMLEYALKNKLSESNRLKYEKSLEKLKN